VLADGIFADNVNRPLDWELRHDRPPRRSGVDRLEQVRPAIIVPMTIESKVCGRGVEMGAFNPCDPAVGRHVGNLLTDIEPGPGGGPANVDAAVIAPGVEQTGLERRFRQRRQSVAHERIAPWPTARQIRTDRLPLVAAMRRAKYVIAAEIDCSRIMRRHEERRVPVESKFRRATRRFGLDVRTHAGAQVDSTSMSAL